MTLPEVLLWERLRRSHLGVKFRNQHSIPPYVVDFYCASARLVVEIDGLAHDNAERADSDASRDQSLVGKGYDVLRLPASLVLSDMEAALAAIAARVESPLRQPLRGCHLPASGEDLQ
jgi:very-short-patch-repair endonuclease